MTKMNMSPYIAILTFTIYIGLSTSYPAEEPTKFSLQKPNERKVSNPQLSRLEQGQEFLGRVADTIRIGRERLVNSLTLARNIIVDRMELITSEAQNHAVSVPPAKTEVFDQGRSASNSVPSLSSFRLFPPVTRETVRLETEEGQALLERKIPKPAERVLENFLKPTPIVDGIREEDKYGNTGDRFIGIGRALVDGFEGLSNFLNAIVDLPIKSAKKTSRGITEALNHIGARIIGLE